jgi:hypothetical protein
MKFSGFQNQATGIIVYQVPRVAGQFALYVFQKIPRSKDVECLVATNQESQQPVKTGKVIHVGVGHENMAYLKDFPRGEGGDVTQIEKNGTVLKKERNEEPRVVERVVNQAGTECRTHFRGDTF